MKYIIKIKSTPPRLRGFIFNLETVLINSYFLVYLFSRLSADLLGSTKVFLESSIEDCSKKYCPGEDNPQRHRMLGACREYKNIFKEMRVRASKALAFARMLHKDLGIANKYTMNCKTDALFKLLKDSKHFKVCESKKN